MTKKQWQAFCEFKEIFSAKVEEWKKSAPELAELQKEAALAAKTPEYPFETSVVYNRDLDKITENDDIKLIVIGDNPGKDEQLAKNNRYLVGQAGKIADGFFRRNPELQTDFRKNVIILNKTPVHSAKTAQLKRIMKDGGEKIRALVEESQLWMAEQTARLHCALVDGAGALENKSSSGDRAFSIPELWLVGYSELKAKGFFLPYRDRLKETYFQTNADVWKQVYVFQHFSMNRFTIDLAEFVEKQEEKSGSAADQSLLKNIHALGELHKKEIFG